MPQSFPHPDEWPLFYGYPAHSTALEALDHKEAMLVG